MLVFRKTIRPEAFRSGFQPKNSHCIEEKLVTVFRFSLPLSQDESNVTHSLSYYVLEQWNTRYNLTRFLQKK